LDDVFYDDVAYIMVWVYGVWLAYGWGMVLGIGLSGEIEARIDTLVLYVWARGGYWMVEGVYDLDMTVALKYIQEIFADFCLR